MTKLSAYATSFQHKLQLLVSQFFRAKCVMSYATFLLVDLVFFWLGFD